MPRFALQNFCPKGLGGKMSICTSREFGLLYTVCAVGQTVHMEKEIHDEEISL